MYVWQEDFEDTRIPAISEIEMVRYVMLERLWLCASKSSMKFNEWNERVVDEYTVPGYNVGHYKAPGYGMKNILLHVHTHYSLLDGLSKPESIAQRCSKLGMSSCAITDHGTISGCIRFTYHEKSWH